MGTRKLCVIPEHSGRTVTPTPQQIRNEWGDTKRPQTILRMTGSTGSVKQDQPWAIVVIGFLSAHLNKITKAMEASRWWTQHSLSAPDSGEPEAKWWLFWTASSAFEEYDPLEKYLQAKWSPTLLAVSLQNALPGAESVFRKQFFFRKKEMNSMTNSFQHSYSN